MPLRDDRGIVLDVTIMVMYEWEMKTVSIADLKSHLSTYLNQVREGAEIIIRDRSTPIARILPLSTLEDLDMEERTLIAQGKLRPAAQSLAESFFDLPAPRVKRQRVAAAIAEDRDRD